MFNHLIALVLIIALLLAGCTNSHLGGSQNPPASSPDSAPPHIDLSGIGQTIGSFGGGIAGGFTGSVTGTALSSFVDSVVDSLKNVGNELGGNVEIDTDHAAQDLAGLEQDFTTMLHGQVAVPINTLSFSIQDAAQQLNSVATRLQAILNNQQQQLYINLTVFDAAIETAALEMHGGLLLGSRQSPRIFYFSFNQLLPEMVPESGGIMTIVGYRLWESEQPLVALEDTSGGTIASLQPARGNSDNSIALAIPPQTVRSLAGQTVVFHIIPRQSTTSFVVIRKTVNLAPLNLYVQIPAEYQLGFRLAGHIQYPVVTQRTEKLPSQNFGFDNTSCESNRQVTLSRNWSLPPQGRIIAHDDNQIYNVQNNNIQVNITASDTITASGTIDTAACFDGPFGIHKYQHSASWSVDVTPTVQYPDTETRSNDQQTTVGQIQFPSTQILLDIPKPDSETTTVWFELFPIVNGKEGARMYLSPKMTVGQSAGGNFQTFNAGGLTIRGSYVPNTSAGTSELTVYLDANGLTHS